MGKVLTQEIGNGRPMDSSAESADTPALSVPDDLVDNLTKLFKLLSDDTRLRILYYLTQREELHVRALCELLKESQPAVSHHLSRLREAGVLTARRDGKQRFYRLMPQRCRDVLEAAFQGLEDAKN